MLSAPSFAPRWASPPGDTIKDALRERGISLRDFAAMMDLSPGLTTALLEGSEAISLTLARKLAGIIGASVEFWMTRDAQYRDDVARVAVDRWASTLPTKDMHRFGWLEKTSSWQDQIVACMDYFDVSDFNAWQASYGRLVAEARFRISPTARTNAPSVAVWLRQAEIEADRTDSRAWNPLQFRNSLDDARSLTRERDPSLFLPALKTLCAESGVSLVVLRSPEGCPASGVARFLSPQKPLLVLSGRFLTDDHLWFTFFHEAGHLLLHDSHAVFVDELSQASGASSAVENEADMFAEEILFPAKLQAELPPGRISTRDVLRLSKKAGVGPGIMAGQLQHRGNIEYNQLNGLKRRYKWNGPILEMA